MLTEDQSNAVFLNHLYNALVKEVDLKPGIIFNTEGSMNLRGGYKVVVHSNDHGTHFHVQYNGIDARFSFPEVQLINHVSKQQFTSRQIRNVIAACNNNPMCGRFVESELRRAGRLA
jgi:hypothetical protein